MQYFPLPDFLLEKQHEWEYANWKVPANRDPRLDMHSNISGTPNNAYTIVTILPSGVFGAKLP